ncbi:helix-turn-helix transcriptional regulator [Paenibacillus sp. FSL K6-1217]|uniref:helix-turn-helix transcriptional regulator n=1 Tax=Paenibacillus sp. FSL K6-1217 TaxID=2921466 RepID=UPI0032544A4D
MIDLTSRQLLIIEIVKKHAPITGDQIAEQLQLSRPTIRSDLSVLVMLEYIDAKPKVGYFLGKKVSGKLKGSDVLKETKVAAILSTPIIVRETATIQDAVVTLFLQNVGTLVICDEESRMAGVASRKDFLKVTLGNPAAATMPVSMVMTRRTKVVTVSPEDTVLEAASKMIVHEVDSLPVLHPEFKQADMGQEVIGRLTKTAIIKLLLEFELNV